MRENIKISLLDRIKSNMFMLYAAIFTVAFLAPNTYYVYYSFCVFSSPWRELASAGVACIVAASILIYTLRKNFRVAKYYTLFEISISAYYYISTIGWDWGLIPALGFTLILPISIYYYSKEIDTQSIDTISVLEKKVERAEHVADSRLETIKEITEERDHYKSVAGNFSTEKNKLRDFYEEEIKMLKYQKDVEYVQLAGRGNRLVPVENVRKDSEHFNDAKTYSKPVDNSELQEEELVEQQSIHSEIGVASVAFHKEPNDVRVIGATATPIRAESVDNEKFIEELEKEEVSAKQKGGARKKL